MCSFSLQSFEWLAQSEATTTTTKYSRTSFASRTARVLRLLTVVACCVLVEAFARFGRASPAEAIHLGVETHAREAAIMLEHVQVHHLALVGAVHLAAFEVEKRLW